MIHIFIINPFAGQKTFADDLRTKLDNIKGLDYFVFNTRCAGYETELVRKVQHIFEGEKLRFYCCGGSGTMRNMLNGFEDISEVEIAFYPCGLTNDFLKMFGNDIDRFHNIEELIYGEVLKVDYIKTNYGISLNSLSTGLDSNCLDHMDNLRILRLVNESLPYFFATLYSIFVADNKEYEVRLDSEVYRGKFSEIFIGNGCVFGGNMHFADHTVINDGKALYNLTSNKRAFRMLNVLLALIGKKFDKLKKLTSYGECSRIRICRTDGTPFEINQDGDLIRDVSVCEAQIVRRGLKLIVPRGVRI